MIMILKRSLSLASAAIMLSALLISCGGGEDGVTPAPGQVQLALLSTGADSIVMTWTDPSDSNFAYATVTCNGTETKIEKGVGTCTVTGLNSNTKYTISIRSYSTAGHGSDPFSFSALTTSSGTRTYNLVRTAEDMNNVRNNLSGYYILMNDISLSAYASGAGWTRIGTDGNPFTGTFDGNGHAISNLTINSASDYQGLFGYVSGTIKNTGLEDISVRGSYYAGGLAGYLKSGEVSNCYAKGSVNGGESGGLVGESEGTIHDSYAAVSVSGNSHIGGLVGYLISGEISNCYATGSISGGEYAGGLVGISRGTITNNCYATGSTSGSKYVGGLIGINDGTLNNCYSTGSVTGSSSIGGLIGLNEGTITNCYSTGAVQYR